MVWGAFCAANTLPIAFTSHRIDSEEYTGILDATLVPFIKRRRRQQLTFQQDNAPAHKARDTTDFLESKNIPVLSWPACSPDLNPIENLWGVLVSKVYADGRQYDSVQQLKLGIERAWNAMPIKTLNQREGPLRAPPSLDA